MTKRILTILLMTAVLFAAVGCAEGTRTVRLQEVTHSVFYAPQYAAIELGYFEEEGIKLELTNAGGADKAMAALLSGQSDIAFCGPEAAVYVHNEGRKDGVVVVGQLTIRDGAFLLGREPREDFDWSELRGKSVIGGRKGGAPCMALERAIRNHGMEPGVDVDVMTHVQFNLMGGAFAGGEGDYVTLFEPAATQAVAEGYGHILAAVGDSAGEIAYTCYMVPQSSLKKNADMIEGFLRALYRGQRYVAEHSALEVAQVIAPSFPDTDVQTLEQVVQRYRSIGAWTETPLVQAESIEALMDIMQDAGELERRAPVDDIIDNTIAEKAMK